LRALFTYGRFLLRYYVSSHDCDFSERRSHRPLGIYSTDFRRRSRGDRFAIGLAKNGVSLGLTSNYTEDEAKRRAMANCHDIGSKISKSLCRVLTTFRDQCATAAIDPQAGTPGFGWSLGENIRDAERKALAKCEETAGPKRRAACVVRIKGTCDGTAKSN
jgi:hypothetical protein